MTGNGSGRTWPPFSPFLRPRRNFWNENIAGITESTHTVNTVVARLAPGANLQEVQERISRWNHFRPISVEEQTKILTKGMIEKARMQLGLFRIILLVISAVIISLIIYTSTLDKIKVIATLKLIGSQNRVIVGMILQQSLLMGVIAYGIGYGLILLTYEKFPRRIVLEAFDLQALFRHCHRHLHDFKLCRDTEGA